MSRGTGASRQIPGRASRIGSGSAEPLNRRRQMVSLAEAALSVSERTLRRRIADGSLTGYRVGPRLIRIDLAELDDLLREIPLAG